MATADVMVVASFSSLSFKAKSCSCLSVLALLKSAMRDSFVHLYVGRVLFSASRPSTDSLCLHDRREMTTPNYNFLRAFSKTSRVVDSENALIKL